MPPRGRLKLGDDSEAGVLDLDAIVAALRHDYGKLAPRIRSLDHTVICECDGVTLRLHFPSLRQGKATVYELVELISHHLTAFALPRAEVAAVDSLYGTVPVEEFKLKVSQLSDAARGLFKRANEATNRNGEAGELLLYLLTEWILGAPQLIAKMSLKTNKEMPVHGADGVHVRYCTETNRLLLYWGESKLYADVSQAIAAAVTSVTDALKPEKTQHELQLVQRNISFAGLDETSKEALLRYLDPCDEAYNERHDVATCLIGFNFDAYNAVTPADGAAAEEKFAALARAQLAKLAPTAAKAIKSAGLAGLPIEIFFFPVPSVQEFRDLFQAKIGWTQ